MDAGPKAETRPWPAAALPLLGDDCDRRGRAPLAPGVAPPIPPKNIENNKNTKFSIFLCGRWEDLDRWKWVVIDMGVILDTSANHSENFFVFRHVLGPTPLYPNIGINN